LLSAGIINEKLDVMPNILLANNDNSTSSGSLNAALIDIQDALYVEDLGDLLTDTLAIAISLHRECPRQHLVAVTEGVQAIVC
jgi:hypothetical protein